jgi:glycosyltransferase involved in cell wall biosynthesis
VPVRRYSCPRALNVTDPRISVYLPSHNYGRFLGEAIESVLRQTVDDWELIVIDDGSTDETSSVMDLYRGHPRIFLHRKEGIGLTAVCNFALGQARGKYVVRLDGDDVFDENILLVLGNMLDRDPKLALVFPDFYLVDQFGDVFGQERRKRLDSRSHAIDMPPNGACTLVRADVLKEVGGYREDLGAQDGFDLWTKVVSRYKCANVNLPLFYYRRHGENLTTNTQRIINARRQIKKDAARERLATPRPVLAVIPCRRNFDFMPDVWNEKVGGASLLDRDIRVCLSSDMFDHIVVTSDNPETAEAVCRFNDPRLRFVLRDPKSTIRTASVVSTLEMIARDLDPELKGMTVLRYIQSPFVTVDTLEEAISTLAMSEADSSNGVEEIGGQVFRRTRHGIELLNRLGELRSDFDKIYRDVQTCVAIRNSNLQTGSLMGRSTTSFVVSAAECFFIDSEHKLRLARLMTGQDA